MTTTDADEALALFLDSVKRAATGTLGAYEGGAVLVEIDGRLYPCKVALDGELMLTAEMRAALPEAMRADVFRIGGEDE